MNSICQLRHNTERQPGELFRFRKKFLKVHNLNFENHSKPRKIFLTQTSPYTLKKLLKNFQPSDTRKFKKFSPKPLNSFLKKTCSTPGNELFRD